MSRPWAIFSSCLSVYPILDKYGMKRSGFCSVGVYLRYVAVTKDEAVRRYGTCYGTVRVVVTFGVVDGRRGIREVLRQRQTI